MIEKIRNSITITCINADFTEATDIEFYIRQDDLFFQYTPTVVSSHVLAVVIPKEDAFRLDTGKIKMQFAYTDADGNPHASTVKGSSVTEFLKEAGYGV